MAMMYVKIKPAEVEVSELVLAHLLWDAMMEQVAEDPEHAVHTMVNLPAVLTKRLIAKRIAAVGMRSVDVGPQHDYPSDEVAQHALERVRRIYEV